MREGEVDLGQRKEMVLEEMFEAFVAKHTFLVKKPAKIDLSKEVTNTEMLECSMEYVFEVIEQVGLEKKQVQPVVQFGSFSLLSVNMMHILPQEFQAKDKSQEGQEIDPIPVSSEDS